MPERWLQTDRPAALRISFPPDATAARAAAAAVRSFLAEETLAEAELAACELAVAEACNNACQYARPDRQAEPIAVEAVLTAAEVEIRVTDHTGGFTLPERIETPSPFRERGRGVFLIQSLMDEVGYLRGPVRNVLVMSKRRQAAPVVPAASAASIESAAESLTQAAAVPTVEEMADARRVIANLCRELRSRSETLSAVFRCCAELGQNVAGFEERLLRDLLHLSGGDWFVLRLAGPEQGPLAVTAASDRALFCAPLRSVAGDGAPHSLEERAAQTRRPVPFLASECPVGSTEPLLQAGPAADGLVYPICFGETLVGTLAVGRHEGGFAIAGLQNQVVAAFAEFLAIQIITLGQRQAEVRDRVVSRELEIAQEIQRNLLPTKLPQLPEFSLAGGWQCAREVGGDFYDALPVGDRSLLLLVADVMGKGVPAALFSTMMRGMLRDLSTRVTDPAQLLSELNRLLHPELSSVGMFITAQIVLLDAKSRRVTAASAGHCPLLYTPPGHAGVVPLSTRGFPLGVRLDATYHCASAILGQPGAMLLHTDGLTDTRNPAGEAFGQRRLMQWLRRHSRPGPDTAEALGQSLLRDLNLFRGEAPMVDDQAFLLLTAEEYSGRNLLKGWWQSRLARHAETAFQPVDAVPSA